MMIGKRTFTWTIRVAIALLAPVIVLAQAPPDPPAPVTPKIEQPDSTACTPSDTPSTTGKGGETEVQKPDDSDLSERLAQSGGVICPPSQLDPEIHAPTPPGGRMPVIPPPGSPGGDRSLQPK